ncbi:hypothetical protein Bca52824_045792, partial [Brassica carinata]
WCNQASCQTCSSLHRDMLRIQPINDSNTINEKPTNILRVRVSCERSRSPLSMY